MLLLWHFHVQQDIELVISESWCSCHLNIVFTAEHVVYLILTHLIFLIYKHTMNCCQQYVSLCARNITKLSKCLPKAGHNVQIHFQDILTRVYNFTRTVHTVTMYNLTRTVHTVTKETICRAWYINLNRMCPSCTNTVTATRSLKTWRTAHSGYPE